MMPGAGYSRGYYDLPEAEFSETAFHIRHGMVVIALDHLGVGESGLSQGEESTCAALARANAQAVRAVFAQLETGHAGLPPMSPAALIGAGHSMGGYVLVTMQADERLFDGIAVLGASMVATNLPHRPNSEAPALPSAASGADRAMHAVQSIDWRWAFHWEEYSTHPLIVADADAGIPVRIADRPWASRTMPACVQSLMLPGVVAKEAAVIEVPVLIAMGERDVCHPPLDEAAAFSAAADLGWYVVPNMAHMHNFAPARALLWMRIESFALQIATMRQSSAAK